MVVDPKAAEFFVVQMQDPENNICCDCGTEGAAWASISHGIYLSIEAAGLHRSLGVKVSFVQSTAMDSWRPVHLRMMELGGNRRFHDFLREQGVPEDMPTREKYSTRAAKWYRENLKACAEETEPPASLIPGTGHLPVDTQSSSAQQVLDQVFAVAPCSGSMTSGGVLAGRRMPQRQRTGGPRQASESFWGVLGATVSQMRLTHSAPAALGRPEAGGDPDPKRSRAVSATPPAARCLAPKLGLERFFFSAPLPMRRGSSNGNSNADRLQTMSTGMMEGFGSDCCRLPTLLIARSNQTSEEVCGPDSCHGQLLSKARPCA